MYFQSFFCFYVFCFLFFMLIMCIFWVVKSNNRQNHTKPKLRCLMTYPGPVFPLRFSSFGQFYKISQNWRGVSKLKIGLLNQKYLFLHISQNLLTQFSKQRCKFSCFHEVQILALLFRFTLFWRLVVHTCLLFQMFPSGQITSFSKVLCHTEQCPRLGE